MKDARPRALAVEGTRRLADDCVVVVTGLGPMFPRPSGAQRGLGAAGLSLLVRLASGGPVGRAIDEVARESAVPPGLLRRLAVELDEDGLLAAPEKSAREWRRAEALRAERAAPPGRLVFHHPKCFEVSPAGFSCFDHAGRVVTTLGAAEMDAAAGFGRGLTPAEAFAEHGGRARGLALGADAFDALVRHLVGVGLLRTTSTPSPMLRRSSDRERTAEYVRHAAELERAAEAARRDRVPVVPVHPNHSIPLSLGLLVSYARAYQDGRLQDHYDFRPLWYVDEELLTELARRRSVFLFSSYVWSLERNLEFSKRVKAINPRSITVHGGPSTPKYAPDVEEFMRSHPHVDVMARGEGEVTAAEVLSALAEGGPDTAVLRKVEGISFRNGDAVVRTGDRTRIRDLDTIPSPYLEGLFDDFVRIARPAGGVVETNRGCPYGCTFCDWGSATLSKIRKFSLDRVLGEIEWCAKFGVRTVGLADANFGIFERDIEIAEKVAAVKRTYGYPVSFGTSFAKNTTKHLPRVVRTMAEAKIQTFGTLSLQTMDPQTLEAVHRSNIKLEKYDDLAREFVKAGLPLYVELMMGLPGSTVDSFKSDLQMCVDRELHAKVHQTQLLANSPMNDPSYRQRHGISTKVGLMVMQSATFSRADYDSMQRLLRTFVLAENYGVLRHVTRYVRHETGTREIDFLHRLDAEVRRSPAAWPILKLALDVSADVLVEPVSWKFLMQDVHRYLVDVVGLPDDDALATVLRVQHALLPSHRRRFPEELELEHDFVSWHGKMIDSKTRRGAGSWLDEVPPLRELPAGTMTVTDPDQVCEHAQGWNADDLHHSGGWELASPVARSVIAAHRMM